MKVKLFSSSGIFQHNVFMDGFTLNDFLTLYRNPDQANEAATKRYVDSFPTVYDVSKISGATIPKGVLVGGFGGDLMGFNRTDVFLTPTGVTPGTYNRVTVNEKGRITAATTESEGSGNVLQFAGILDRPVKADGYVADTSGYAVKTDGAASVLTLTGNLTTSVAPSTPTHTVTQTYLTTKTAAMTASIPVGTLKITTAANAGAEYLKANGGVLDKATYAALYAVIGDTYRSGSGMGYMGQPWRQQYAFNTATHPAALTWTTGTPLPVGVQGSQAIVTKNRVYLLGGADMNGTTSSTVFTAPINPDGTLGAWTTGSSLPAIVGVSQSIVTKNRVYLLGGNISGGSASSAVYTAPISADGTLGAWTTGTSLPTNVHSSQAIVTKDRVYLLGGVNGALSSAVYTTPINADGTLGAWTTGTPLPAGVVYSQAIVTKDRVYLLGGQINDYPSSTVYTAPINADGTLGAWTTGTPLPATVYMSQAIVTKDRVYLLGGFINGPLSSTVYTAPINADGTLGAWTTDTPLPATVANSQAIVTSSKVYILGDVAGAGNEVYQADFTGGTNDYVTLIASNTGTHITQFKLPDLTTQTNGTMEYFIRAVA